jgi:hypothetical protein
MEMCRIDLGGPIVQEKERPSGERLIGASNLATALALGIRQAQVQAEQQVQTTRLV